MQRNITCLGMALLLLLGAAACAEEPSGRASTVVQPAELLERIQAQSAPLILDVRSAQEYAGAHIPDAVNIPHDELAGRLHELAIAKSDEVVVHCESGRRAGLAEAVLVEAGYTDVRDLAGHMRAWRAAAHPTE